MIKVIIPKNDESSFETEITSSDYEVEFHQGLLYKEGERSESEKHITLPPGTKRKKAIFRIIAKEVTIEIPAVVLHEAVRRSIEEGS